MSADHLTALRLAEQEQLAGLAGLPAPAGTDGLLARTLVPADTAFVVGLGLGAMMFGRNDSYYILGRWRRASPAAPWELAYRRLVGVRPGDEGELDDLGAAELEAS